MCLLINPNRRVFEGKMGMSQSYNNIPTLYPTMWGRPSYNQRIILIVNIEPKTQPQTQQNRKGENRRTIHQKKKKKMAM